MKEISAEGDLRMRLLAIREVGNDQRLVDATIARNVLHEELGYFDRPLQIYNLDEATRDRLLVHARQDAAHAVIAAGTLAKELRKLRRTLAIALTVSALMALVVTIGVAAHFWP